MLSIKPSKNSVHVVSALVVGLLARWLHYHQQNVVANGHYQ